MPRRIEVFSVATGRYLDFWLKLAEDIDANFFPDDDVRVTVFTDRSEEASALQLVRVQMRVVPTAALGWPDATLMRYELIASIPDVSDADIVVHLDADMRIPSALGPELESQDWRSGLAFVRHPGFSRRLTGYFGMVGDMRGLLGEVRMRTINVGSLGTWEEDPKSLAFVGRSRRRVYVCGGVWFGTGIAITEMCASLSKRTRIDLRRGHMARWHDESYLNWYAASRPVTVLGAEFCWAPEYSRMITGGPRIVAVNKGDDWLRAPNL